MENKIFSLYDVVVYSIRAILENIRLWTLFFLNGVLVFGAFVVSAGIVAWPLVGALIRFRKQIILSGMMDKTVIMKQCMTIVAAHPMALALGVLIIILGLLGLALGTVRIALDVHDNGTSSPLRLFSCFYLVPKTFVLVVLVLPVVLLGFLFFIVPGIYLCIRGCFVSHYLVDKNAGIIESIKRSFNATRGIEWNIFGLFLISNTLRLLGLVLSMPMAAMMGVAMYRQVQK